MDDAHHFSVESLQILCLNQLNSTLEYFSPQLLSCIPPTLRYRLFLRSPIVDICRLEKTCAFDGIDTDELWDELYFKHWYRWNQWRGDNYTTHKNVELISTHITNREKYFTLVTSIIFCAERPSGYFEYLNKIITSKNHKWSRCDIVPQHTAKFYPTDIVNYLVAADEKPEVEPQVYSMCDFEKNEYSNLRPVPQCNLDDSRDDRKLSCNYDHLSTKHQRIPQHYSSLVYYKHWFPHFR